MAMILDAVVGKVVDELMSAVIEVKDRAVKYKPSLERLESTLQSLGPLINQIDELKKRLDRPAEETNKLINHMKSGKKIVLKCSEKVKWWNCFYKAKYQEEMEELDQEIRRFFELDLRAQDTIIGLETLVVVKEVQQVQREIKNEIVRNQIVELRGVCSPPEPPSFIVGFDVPLNELKITLLRDQVSVSVVMVTGSAGSGKSTLAKALCWDVDVKDTFKKNIFFATFAKTPKLSTIVQKLYQHNGYKVPDEFQGDEDAKNQLENLLKQIGKDGPILLVIDDVWLGSESLIDDFVFQIPNYKILVTSRVAIGRFGLPYVLKPLAEPDDIKLLLHHSASLNQRISDDIPHDVVKKIARGCSGSPMALTVCGRSLSNKEQVVWENRAKSLLKGRTILDSSTDVISSLEKILDVLDTKTIECFRDLGLFPVDQRISATALVDMWAELYNEDDASAMEKILDLVYLNMVDIFVTRRVTSDTVDYNYHYLTQFGLLRDLAIRHISQEPEYQRNRLIIDLTGNNLPSWWTVQNEYHIAARMLSISVDETFTSEWCNLQPTEVEALVLNIRAKKCTLPMFMKKMNNLKVLIITNHEFYHAILENFEILDHLPNLKRIRLEKVTIPSLSKSWLQMKNLQKCSFFMCNVNEAFKNITIQDSEMLSNLIELNFDYCNIVEFPAILSNIVSLKKLRITNCHKLSSLPEDFGKLINLESLRLSSCTDLLGLPDSITRLHNLKFLDISNCTSLNELPKNIGKLGKLEKLNVRGCSEINDKELPSSIMDLKGLKHVVCDEEAASYWEPYTSILSDLRVEIANAEFRLDFLNSLH